MGDCWISAFLNYTHISGSFSLSYPSIFSRVLERVVQPFRTRWMAQEDHTCKYFSESSHTLRLPLFPAIFELIYNHFYFLS